MKKSFIWAMAATLIAGSAFAQSSLNATRFAIAPNATFATGSPATTNNDDSCDITVSPAATLLLPHFEVDVRPGVSSADAVNTLFTITNVSAVPQIAHITVWTDWSFPVLDFNIFLTGYDVQGINLLDLIGRGQIPPTSNTTARGSRSLNNTTGNVNFAASAAAACNNLPGPINPGLLADVQSALTNGDYSTCAEPVGSVHTTAQGYITVDVANTCSQTLPTTATYYSGEILYDNVLIGDYQRINPTSAAGNYAGGNPLVHIKAIPEGGPVGITSAAAGSNLPYTYYDRYTPATDRRQDRRQPLPALFAARFIQGGTGSFNTRYAIWREGITTGAETEDCSSGLLELNGALPIQEVVRFDESENPTTINPGCRVSPCVDVVGTLPETSITSVDAAGTFPPDASTSDAGGWMYLNLDNDFDTAADPTYTVTGPTARTTRASQNWVIVQMTAEGRYGVDFNAAYLGNGCSPEAGDAIVATIGSNSPGAIGPAGGICASAIAPCPTINTVP